MSRSPGVPSVPFTVIVPTVYGPMLVNRYDVNQANALYKSGQAFDHRDILLLTQVLGLLGTDLTVLDVGANFGTFTIALAPFVGPNGSVHAFEPQRLIYNLLVGSVALNSLTNAYCYNVALGDRETLIEIPQYDYNKEMNFGSIEFHGKQSEPLPQQRAHDPTKTEYVLLTTIDRFGFPNAHLIKIDAEGMELQVLQGSIQTIRRCRPVLFVEYIKSDKTALRETILQTDYVVYDVLQNFLCIPREQSNRIKIVPANPAAMGGETGAQAVGPT
jgi:FkbM family methyltransferase